MIRMNNLQNEGWDFNDLKYIQLPQSEAEKYRLRVGDILFNRTNSKELVGKCEVFREQGHWVFASYLIRVRLDETKALPDFVSAFLNTGAGRAQIDRVSRQIVGMSNVNAEELRALQIPLPTLNTQRKLVDKLKAARDDRQKKIAQAENLLLGLDGFLLQQLGINKPDEDTRQVYAVHLGQICSDKRLNADYFHPERILAIRKQESRIGFRSERLKDIADFIREIVPATASDNYVGLANVQSNTGELVSSNDERAEGTCFQFYKDDVLFARLRPYLNKVYRAEREGVCSTEFHVIRLRKSQNKNQDILPDYLSTVLRSSLVLAQTKHMMSGNTHPRLANEDVVNLVVPIPKSHVQQNIAHEVQRRRMNVRLLRSTAIEEWSLAKADFERDLLGSEA